MKAVLITGVTGFVGSNLVRFFRDDNEIMLYGHSRRKDGIVGGTVKVMADLTADSFDREGIDTIIHMAGIAHDLDRRFRPEDYYRVNFEGTRNVFDAFKKSNARKFIFLSSIKAAVDASDVVIDEECLAKPATDYGKSKRMAEEHILSSYPVGGKKVYVLRPCMIHGPGNKGNLNLLYRFAKSGLPFPFGAYENQRSFLGIDNLSFVIKSIIDKELPSGIYNVADDGFLSSKELFTLVAGELGRKAWTLDLPRAFVETAATLIGRRAMVSKITENLMVSNRKLLSHLGEPLPVTLREGLKRTVKSFRE